MLVAISIYLLNDTLNTFNSGYIYIYIFKKTNPLKNTQTNTNTN